MTSSGEMLWHEARDRADSLVEIGEKLLGSHPIIKNNPEMNKLFEKAMDSCMDLYEALSRKAEA